MPESEVKSMIFCKLPAINAEHLLNNIPKQKLDFSDENLIILQEIGIIQDVNLRLFMTFS